MIFKLIKGLFFMSEHNNSTSKSNYQFIDYVVHNLFPWEMIQFIKMKILILSLI